MAGPLDLEFLQGLNFEQPLTYTVNGEEVDLSAYTALAEVRRRTEDDEPLLTLDVELGDDGSIVLSLDGSVTEDMTWRRGVWDLMLFPTSGPPKRLLAGQATLTVPVSRE